MVESKPVSAWREGYALGCKAVTFNANPHPAGADLALDWAEGWREGMRHWARWGADDAGESGSLAD